MNTQSTNYDLRDLLAPYPDQWVALSRDRRKVLAASKDLQEIDEKVKANDAIFMKVPPHDVALVPAGL